MAVSEQRARWVVLKFGGTSVADSRKILAAARKAIRAQQQGFQVILTGGPSKLEQRYAEEISQRVTKPVTNLVGQTNLKQLLVILENALGVISPDSGPAHMATTVGTPVMGSTR